MYTNVSLYGILQKKLLVILLFGRYCDYIFLLKSKNVVWKGCITLSRWQLIFLFSKKKEDRSTKDQDRHLNYISIPTTNLSKRSSSKYIHQKRNCKTLEGAELYPRDETKEIYKMGVPIYTKGVHEKQKMMENPTEFCQFIQRFKFIICLRLFNHILRDQFSNL